MTKKEFIKQSVEVKIYFYQIVLLLVTCLIFLSVAVYALIVGVISLFWSCLIFTILLFSPFISYYSYRIIYLIRNYHNYKFLTVKFTEIHASLYRGMVYFTVKVPYNEKTLSVDTRSIFTTSWMTIIYPNFEEYINRQVKIALNHQTEEIVVINVA